MATKVNFFLCPSDGATPQVTLPDGVTTFGPSNYHFCTGDGQPGSGHVGDAGNPTNGAQPADGAFILGPAAVDRHDHRRVEQHGGGLGATDRPGLRDHDHHRRRDADAAGRPPGRRLRRRRPRCPTTARRSAATALIAGWRLDKGYAWWDGDYRSSLYNHYLTPNSKIYDCWQSSPPARPGDQGGAEQPPRRRERPVLRRPRRSSSRTRSASRPGGPSRTRGGGEVISADSY